MDLAVGTIRTPDQRLRVFVSSTLRELAPERHAARAAIERLALAPVMFELGARPHPPRELYRAYLQQSDIFVGLYWEQYGWIAPGEDVSGLEDEWNIAPDIPKLIYIKRSEHRQERLAGLLARIHDDDGASYVAFDDADQLGALITSDLATLLAERFDSGRRRGGPIAEPATEAASTEPVGIPSPISRLVGREGELAAVTRMLTTEGCRLATITGPGGIGKSRLSLAAARAVEESFPDGVVFVDLAPVSDPGLVIPAVANALGVRDAGDRSLREVVRSSLAGRRVLLVVDNVEQVVDAAPDLSALLSGTPVCMLATSRVLLHIEGEQSVELGPLAPRDAIDLFVERARAVKPDFELTKENAESVSAVCAALDNAPLAIELAAARVRVLTPSAMVARLDHALPLLVSGSRDRPERQHTLRATIEWSTHLLRAGERELLLRLGVFRKGFTLEAVEWMAEGLDGVDAVDALAALVDGSLVREQDRGSLAWFSMLATVREYARDELEGRDALLQTRQLHAQFCTHLAAEAGRGLSGPEQAAWMSRLIDELDELRAAIDHCLETRHWDGVVQIVWPLNWFWTAAGVLPEVRTWMMRLLAPGIELGERSRVIASSYVSMIDAVQSTDPAPRQVLLRNAEYFHREGDRFGESMMLEAHAIALLVQDPPEVDAAEQDLRRCVDILDGHDAAGIASVGIILGRIEMLRGRIPAAIEQLDESLARARSIPNRLLEESAMASLGWAHLMTQDVERARASFAELLLLSSTIGREEATASALEGMFAVAAASGDTEVAGRLVGAAETIRARKGLSVALIYPLKPILAGLETGPAAATFEAAREAGRDADTDEIVEAALA